MAKAKKTMGEQVGEIISEEKAFSDKMKHVVLSRTKEIINKPRTSAHDPVALVEVVYSLLSLVYENRFYERYMNDQYGGSRPWYMMEDVDYPVAANRLQKLVSYLEDELA